MKILLGIPPHDFFEKAWESEPLTKMLKDVNIPAALPFPDEDISLIAELDNVVIAQCSSNRVVKYWDHVKNIDMNQQTSSTQKFINIHKKAIEDEEIYLASIGEPKSKSFHNAGIAVLPKHRGHRIGEKLTEAEIELCSKSNATTLFCETTNKYSAAIVQSLRFFKIKEYLYKDLAVELSTPELCESSDSFSVWCRKL
jgi:ribosomal protein S18 acetylase RimI-like enzyme